MGTAPFVFVGEKAAGSQHLREGLWLIALAFAHTVSFGEIIPAEGLQRVAGGQCFGYGNVRLVWHLPKAIEMILQLTHKHRRWAFGIVFDAAPYPADVKLFAG